MLASAITPALAVELGNLERNPSADEINIDAPSLYIASIASPNLATGMTNSGPASPISAGVADRTYPPMAKGTLICSEILLKSIILLNAPPLSLLNDPFVNAGNGLAPIKPARAKIEPNSKAGFAISKIVASSL